MTNQEAIEDIRNNIKPIVGGKSLDMAIEALEERKAGRWIFQTITQGKRMWCSNCNSAFDLCCNQIKRYDEATKKNYLWVYCPWCGAKMEVEHETD